MITKEQYHQLTATWSAKKEHTAAEHIAYNILRGKDAKLGFTPIASHNISKITSNCCNPWNGFNQARADVIRDLTRYFQEASRDEARRMVRYGRYTDENAAFADLTLRIADQQKAIEQRFMDTFGIKLTGSLAEALKAAL